MGQGSARRQILLAGIIVAVTLLAYIPAMRGGYFWDDDRFLYASKLIHAPDGLRRFWLTADATDYFPLTSSMLWIEWRLWGNHPAGCHVVNVLLHAACAVLLWRVLRRLSVRGAWLAGMIFALHPVAAASTAWITEGKNTLSLLLCAASLLAYLKFEDSEINVPVSNHPFPASPRLRVSASVHPLYLLSVTLFLLALLAKTSVVMLPAVLLLCAWWRRGRISQRDILRSVPFFALSLALGIVTVWFQQAHAINGVIVRPEHLASRIAAVGWIAWFYLFKVLLPAGLCVIYPRWDVPGSGVLAFLPLILLAAGLALLWAHRKNWGRAPLFALAYFLLMLLPVLGIADMSLMDYTLAADHLQYAAMIGVIAFAAAILARAAAAPARSGQIGTVAATGCVALLGVLTWNRAALYGDARSLWQDNVNKNPAAWLAWNNLGWTWHRAGNDEKAIPFFSKAIELNPKYALAYTNRAGARARLGRYADALEDCDKAIQYERAPASAFAYNTRGNIHLEMGQLPAAVADYGEAIKCNPDFADAYGNRAVAYSEMKEYDKAWADVKKCETLGGKPDPAFVQALRQASGRTE